MSDLNIIILSGYFGKDPELSYFQDGTPLCKFSLGTSKQWTNKNGERQSLTEWNNIQVTGKFAEIVSQYTKKGSHVQIVGELKTSKWTDDAGNNRSMKFVKAKEVNFLDKKSESDVSGQNQQQYNQTPPPQPNTAQNGSYGRSAPVDDLPNDDLDLPF